jgi:septal ring factor EnvC (AmiA/AmiB activator)
LHFAHSFAADNLAQINAQIKQTEQQKKQIEQQVKTSDKEIEATQKRLVSAADKVSDIETTRAGISRKISELDSRRAALAQKLSANKDRIAESAAGILFIASNPSFDSDDMREYVLTSAVLAGAAQNLDSEMQQAARQVKELDAIIVARAAEKSKLDKTAKKYEAERRDLDKLLRARSNQNEKLKVQQYEVQKKLRDLSARAKNFSDLSSGVGSTEMSGSDRFSSRKLNSPVRGRLVMTYGEKTALGLESDGWRIRVRGDALVVAPADGIVKFADSFRGFGKVLILSHTNGYNTVMANMGSVDVLIGQEVLAGEPVGRMNSDRPEMYLEVRRGARAVDPARLFNEP